VTGVGFSLGPDDALLELGAEAILLADYLEVAPETSWADESGRLWPNDFHSRYLSLGHGRPFVAHGVDLAPASASPAAIAEAVERMRHDVAHFDYRWWSEHAGATELAGEPIELPVAVPWTDSRIARMARALGSMRDAVDVVAVENVAAYFAIEPPHSEARGLGQLSAACGAWLVLDLHNVWVSARAIGAPVDTWLDALPLERVIEIHVSGGSDSAAGWLASGRVIRLDSHDDAVPDEVWSMLERVLPRCPSVRGVTLERMDGSIDSALDGRLLAEEMRRLRRMVSRT
jgi:uncharacterized protein